MMPTLSDYHRKRNFARTPEPRGQHARTTRGELRFVVQKHAASHLHFDFRLQLDGVLKSWAVPKGPSLDPHVKRLAIEVEDHPIDYSDFEGTIPAGEYGAGIVMLWDLGTYTVDGPDADERKDHAMDGRAEALRRGYAAGTLNIVLDGERLRGRFALVRTARGTSAPGSWLLIKRRDAFAEPGSDVARDFTTSVATGRTMREIAGDERAPGPADDAPVNDSSADDARAGTVVEQLERIEHTGGAGTLRPARGQTLEVSHLDRTFFPELGCTKGDLMRYYARVAPVLLPLVADRPLVLKRSPEGVAGETFFQQNAPDNLPDAVRAASVPSEGGRVHERIVGGTLATLLYTVQLGCISVDPWHSRVQSLDTADYAVLDLDPASDVPFHRVVEVARWVKEELDALSLVAALKTSGSRGLHIVVPLPARTSYEVAARLAQHVAERVARSHPGIATVERALKARPAGSVYVDHLQNARGKSLAAAYCVRARPLATVSTPLEWGELAPGLDPTRFTMNTVPGRIADVGDLWGAAMRRRNTSRTLHAVLG